MDGEFFFYAGLGCFGVVLGIIVWAFITRDNHPYYGWADGRLDDLERQRRRREHQERAARSGIAPVTYGMVHPAPRRPPVCVDIETSFDDHYQTHVQYRRKRGDDGPDAA